MGKLKKATFKYKPQPGDKILNLNDAQIILKNIVKDFQSFCEFYNVRFSLAYGTLLGAARNGDIIAWDNDVDLMTTRTDFDKLIKLIPKLSDFGLKAYHYTNARNTYTNEVRIYRDNYYRILESNGKKYLTPLCIDIFPFDKISCDIKSKIKILNKIKKEKDLLELKELKRDSRNMFFGLMRHIKKMFYVFLPSKKLHENIEKNIAKLYSGDNDHYLFSSYDSEQFFQFFDKNMFDDLVMIRFGSIQTYAIKSYKDFLKTTYGDWMKPYDRSNGKVYKCKFLMRIQLK